MEDTYCKFEGFTGFIKKDDQRGTAIETELKIYKDESDGKKKGGKTDGKKRSSSQLH